MKQNQQKPIVVPKISETHICRRCGRKLKNEQAKKIGMGACCHKKWLNEQTRKKLFMVNSLHSPKNNL